MKKLRIVSLLLCILLLLPGAAWAEETGTGFPDVSADAWYAFYVRELAARGVVAGYPDGTFGPEDQVSWGMALKLLLLAAGWPEQEADENGWAGGYLRFAGDQGWLSDLQIQSLDQPITRLETALLAARALGLSPLEEGTSPFADCSDGALLALAEQGILEGVRQDGVLCYLPEDLLTRSQISAIVWRQLRWKDAHPEAPTGGDPKAETPAESTQAPKILYREELLDVWEGVPVNTYQAESFYLENGRMQTRDEGLRLVQGIDVSAHQGVIDWKQVAGDGVEFAILRAGYRGYTVGNVKEDKMFSLNLAGAKKEGLSVGVYFFSQAITPAEALEEAELVLKLLDGCPLELPVVYDWENINDKDARTNGLDQETLTACARAFCDRVAQAGYQPMLYVIQHWAYKRYDLSRLADIPLWFAQYQEQPDFYYDFKLWQYTSKGSVRGIQGNVDRDVLLLRTN